MKGELDYEDWVFTAQGKLEKAGLWHIINTPRPGPVEIDVPADEAEVERKRRVAQKAYEDPLKEQGVHHWGDGDAPSSILPEIPKRRLETEQEHTTRLAPWLKSNKELFGEIIDALGEEGLTLAKAVEYGDGKALWDALAERYGQLSIASKITLLEQLFS